MQFFFFFKKKSDFSCSEFSITFANFLIKIQFLQHRINLILAPSIPRCRRDHPNMSECIVQVINVIAPNFVTGDLGGGFKVPSLEPFNIKQ